MTEQKLFAFLLVLGPAVTDSISVGLRLEPRVNTAECKSRGNIAEEFQRNARLRWKIQRNVFRQRISIFYRRSKKRSMD